LPPRPGGVGRSGRGCAGAGDAHGSPRGCRQGGVGYGIA
jgi:hypothetical protein